MSPPLPAGLTLEPKTGAIAGTPSTPTGKCTYTITARNVRGQASTTIAFAVAGDWQIAHPKEWSVEMCQTWFKDELKLAEDDRSHLVTLDGKQLVLLKSKEAVASKIKQIPPAVQILIAQNVSAVLGKWEAPENHAPLARPIGVKAGDEAKLEYFPFELRADYVPVRVLGVGSFGVVLLAKFVKDGHHKYSEAIKLVFSGGGPTGFWHIHAYHGFISIAGRVYLGSWTQVTPTSREA